jgi:hypothetical protein
MENTRVMSKEGRPIVKRVPRVPGVRHGIRPSSAPPAPRRSLWRDESKTPDVGPSSPLRRPGLARVSVLAEAMRRMVPASFEIQ